MHMVPNVAVFRRDQLGMVASKHTLTSFVQRNDTSDSNALTPKATRNGLRGNKFGSWVLLYGNGSTCTNHIYLNSYEHSNPQQVPAEEPEESCIGGSDAVQAHLQGSNVPPPCGFHGRLQW